MTIPMIPGWWDQNKEALESLAQTTTRMMNPYFDAQLALSQSIRQNPQNMQTAIDTASLNPDMFAQMFGPRMLQQISTMGQPSSTARVEEAARGIMGTAPEAVPNTVATRAATAKLQVESPEQLERARLTIEGERQRQEIAGYNFTREQLENSEKDPITLAQLRTAREAIAQNPNIAAINPEDMARDTLAGKYRGNPGFAQQLSAMSSVNPAGYKAYQYFLDMYARQAQQTEQWRREDARNRTQIDREDRIDRRAALSWAAKQTARTGLALNKLADYYMGNPDPEVEAFFIADEAAEQGRNRIRMMGALAEPIAKYVKAQGGARQLLKAPLELMMTELVGQPVQIEKMSESWINSSSEFTVGGVKMNGAQLHEMMQNPEEYQAMRLLETQAEAVTSDQVSSLIASLPVQVQSGAITQQQADARKAKLEEIRRRKINEEAVASRAGAQKK